jgi:DNA-binding transcriptional LysR family regulator
MPSTDLNAVMTFAKVVELRSFRAAARALGIPKSTVSRKVAELEDSLGARLLERTTRSLRLTDAGAAYQLRVSPALDALREAEHAIEQQRAAPSGRLKITTTVEGGPSVLAPILTEYLELYPDVELRVELTDRRVDLVEEGFDLAIRAGSLPDSTLVARRLGTPGCLRVYASPAYLRKHGEPCHPRELTAHSCLLMSAQSSPAEWAFRQKKKPFSVKVRGRAEANSFVLLRELAVAGHGIARLPEYIAAEQASRLRLILDAFTPEPLPWHAVYPSARNLSPKVRALVDLLEARFSKLAGQLPPERA